MNTQTPIGKFERAGSWLGRLWRALRQDEKRLIQRLIDGGCPAAIAHGLIWVVTLTVLGIVLYASIVVSLVLIVVLLLASLVARSRLPRQAKTVEWRNGLLGFGTYNRRGWRVDPHDTSDPFREP